MSQPAPPGAPSREPGVRSPQPPKPPRPSWRELLAAAGTRRMLGLLALLVVAAVVCARLGAWQIDRAFERAEAARASEEAATSGADPVPLASVLEPGAHLMGVHVGVPVTVTGTYEPQEEVLVPGRVVDGQEGYLVVTPLRTDDPDSPWLAVVRGFVTDPADVPAAPDGELTLVGGLDAGEAYVPRAGLAAGELGSISPAYFAGEWGLPIYNAYLVLTDADAPMETVPRPTLDDGGGVDLRNLAYAVEWYVFGAFALVVWYRLVRDEALARREDGEDDRP